MPIKIQPKIIPKVAPAILGDLNSIGEGGGSPPPIATAPPENITPLVKDTFESGSAQAFWGTFDYTIDTYDNFGITASPIGGTRGAYIEGAELGVYVPLNELEFWVEILARTGADINTNTWFITMTDAGSRVGSSRMESGDELYAFNDSKNGGVVYPGTTPYVINTWLWLGLRIKKGALDGIVELWSWDGFNWTREVNETGLDLDNNLISTIFLGKNTIIQPQGWYADQIKIYDADPGW